MVSMEVVGRHALLFDDDATSAFVNSREALVEWNSLLIDRYDVRHLLHSPPPPLPKTRRQEEESELDQIRYQDLPPPQSQDNYGEEAANAGTYRAVSFSYGTTDVSAEHKNSEEAGFVPPFVVPEYLLQSLPPTEKLHQIMARTALFVSDHGGQSEIVLRVKQGNNPTFGFLMPDHNLHAYFRFLVDHPEFLKSDNDNNKREEHKKADQEQKQTDVGGEALSLLGSIYGSVEDEDGAVLAVPVSKETNDSFIAANDTLHNGSEVPLTSAYTTGVDLAAAPFKNPHPADKEKGTLSKKTRSVNAIASSTSLSKKKEINKFDSLSRSLDKPPPSSSSVSMNSSLVSEPPSEMKRTMDKIVEFILKNGKDFEAVLIEQDRISGRFPFLLPSNQYHPYYLKLLHGAQKSKEAGKSSILDKRSSLFRDSDTLSNGSDDLPFETERKEKFRMVIASLKKDVQEPAPKITQQCGMSVDAAAAILQAATRGLKIPKLENSRKTSLGDSAQGISSEGGPSSSFGTPSYSSQVPTSKHVSKEESSEFDPLELSGSVVLSKAGSRTSDVSVAKAIAKTAALAAASEADSSEACLTKEQKQKAERLKRAKMFATIIKSGAAPQASELLPRLSAEPPDTLLSGAAGSGCKTEAKDGSQVRDSSNSLDFGDVNVMGREREGSSVPVDVDASDRMEKHRKMNSEDDHKERSSKKRHHSRSRRVEEDEDDEEERNHRHTRKKHHSHHSSHSSKGEDRDRKRHSSSKDRESRHRHKRCSSSEDEQHYRSRHYRRRISHSESKVGSEDESGKLFLQSNTDRPSKSASRETSLDLINDRWAGSVPLVEAQQAQPGSATEVPDDLRAKVRAMLLATM